MSRKGQSITLSISDEDKFQLEEIARELGITRGERANISGLVEAIARRQFLVTPDLSKQRIEALQQAIRALIDTGQTQEAHLVATLLLEQSQLEAPLRREIERFLTTPPISWQLELSRYIQRQQPFQLSYQDAANRVWSFVIRYAQLLLHERRQYLDCWCDQTEGNQDLPSLAHNWCLRLDRIPEAAISPVEGKWRSTLDRVEVEIHLFRGLAFAYESKPDDILNEWIENAPQVRRVIRQVTSTFWFFREILRYGEDCEIIGPEEVRSIFKRKLQALVCNYNDSTS